MGNSRARAVYEAHLPDGFRRPQSDSYVMENIGWIIVGSSSSSSFRALESFIRTKYERRKWIAKEWIPPEITVPIDVRVVLCSHLLEFLNFVVRDSLCLLLADRIWTSRKTNGNNIKYRTSESRWKKEISYGIIWFRQRKKYRNSNHFLQYPLVKNLRNFHGLRS